MDSRAASSGGWLRPALPAVLGLVGLAAAARWGGLPSPPPIDLLLRDGMPLAILALAMALVRIGGLVDLSVGGIAMAAAAGLALLPAHWGVGPLPAAAAMVAGSRSSAMW